MKLNATASIVVLLLFCSCTSNSRLEYALDFAGTNRIELEKVLEHYKDSGLKYDAACFLIENMPHYYAYTGGELDSVKAAQTTIFYKKYLDERLKRRWEGFSYKYLDKVYDAQIITADYLIENIDLAFVAWQERPWKNSLSFDEFCEWILPYRIGDEPLENWRRIYKDKYSAMLDSLYRGRDVAVAADSLMRVLVKVGWVYNTDLELPRLGPSFLMEHCVGYCRETCDYTTYVLRSVGIPVGTDMIFGSSLGGHSWSVVRDTTGSTIPFWFAPVVRGGNDGRMKGKVYRMCFGPQKEKIQGMLADKEVPSALKNPYLKDVTSDYFGENSTELEVEKEACGRYVYLGAFSSSGWVPMDITEHHNGKAVMKNIEPDVIYAPLSSKNGNLRVVGYPFWLTKNGLSYFKPEENTERVKLLRKYPLRDWTRYHIAGVVGSRIEASNTLDFRHSELLYQIVDTPKVNYNVVPCSPKQKYRYIRFTAAKEQLARIAELMFFRSMEDTLRMEVRVVAGSEPDRKSKDVEKEKVCDGDYLTYFLSEEEGGYVTLDLGKPEYIGKMVYVPRNDENFISIGDTYELFYQDGVNGWASLGQKVGTEPQLLYDHIPRNALLWLRDLSRGKEEQAFRIENGEQIFLGK